MKEKLIALTLTLLLTLSLTACGGPTGGAASGGAAGGSASGSEMETLEPDGSADVQEPENSPADDSDASDTENLPADTTQKPDAAPVTKPSSGTATKPSGGTATKPSGGTATKPSGGTSSGSTSADLSAFYDMLSADPDFPSMTQITGDTLDTFYAGLSALSPKQCVVYMPMISAVACELALVEVGSSADVKTVKDIFQSRIDYQIEQGAFYPATVEAWQNNAQIVSNGNCVMLICMDGADSVVSSFNALFK